eukprot:965899-Alexandrium_andersonii.AAC.1
MDVISRLMWTSAEQCEGFLLWSRFATEAKHFVLPTSDAPSWHRVTARETIDAKTGLVVDFQSICGARKEFEWRGPWPANPDDILTRFWCILELQDRALSESCGAGGPETREILDQVREFAGGS